jgi:hypothetical protein
MTVAGPGSPEEQMLPFQDNKLSFSNRLKRSESVLVQCGATSASEFLCRNEGDDGQQQTNEGRRTLSALDWRCDGFRHVISRPIRKPIADCPYPPGGDR